MTKGIEWNEWDSSWLFLFLPPFSSHFSLKPNFSTATLHCQSVKCLCQSVKGRKRPLLKAVFCHLPPLECNFQFRPSLVQSEPINFECNGLRCTLNALGFIRASTSACASVALMANKCIAWMDGQTNCLTGFLSKQTNWTNWFNKQMNLLLFT